MRSGAYCFGKDQICGAAGTPDKQTDEGYGHAPYGRTP